MFIITIISGKVKEYKETENFGKAFAISLHALHADFAWAVFSAEKIDAFTAYTGIVYGLLIKLSHRI